jgi:ABC-2 type transport system permease protein
MSGDVVLRDGGGRAPWTAVAVQELRDLWLGGRGLVLAFAFTALLSVIAYLSATNEQLNFLE